MAADTLSGFIAASGGGALLLSDLLLHFDGANGSTTFTDSGQYDATAAITATGGAALSTAQSKFGSASLYIPDTSSYITVASGNPAISFGGPSYPSVNPFSIDFWVMAASANPFDFFDNRISGALIPGTIVAYTDPNATSLLQGYFYNSGALSPNSIEAATTTFPDDEDWHYLEYTATPDIPGGFAVWLDGIRAGYFPTTADWSQMLSNPFNIGGSVAGYGGPCYYDEFHITSGPNCTGHDSYIVSYTPPTAPWGS